MRVHSDLFRICGIVDKKDFAWVPNTEHKIIDYKIEPPIYKLFVDINGNIIEFDHPIHEGLEYLRNNIRKHVNGIKEKRSRARIIS